MEADGQLTIEDFIGTDDSFTYAKNEFWRALEETGDWVPCPVCERRARIYTRRLSSTMPTLLAMARFAPIGDPVHVRQIKDTSGEQSRLELYGFVEKVAVPPEGHSDLPNSGWWRITRQGEAFLRNELSAPTHVKVYDGELLGFTHDRVHVAGALGHPFDLEELLRESKELA